MIRRPPRSTRTDTLFPYTTLFRSDLAHLIGAVDLGGAGAEPDFSDDAQRHRAAALRGDRQILDRRQPFSRILVQGHPYRALAVGQREFRDVLVDLAEGRDPACLAQCRRGYPQVGGMVEARPESGRASWRERVCRLG